MILKTLEYAQHQGQPGEWRLHDLTLGGINLLAGKNATGKSRTLNIINGLARMVAGDRKPDFRSGSWKVEFAHGEESLCYTLELRDRAVIREVFTLGGKKYLDRSEGGSGTIFANKEEKEISFQAPVNELAVVARRDEIQHPHFSLLHAWGKAVHHYQFGTTLGKQHFAVSTNSDEAESLDTRDDKQVVSIFRRGKDSFGTCFEQAVKEDMEAIGYAIEDVGVSRPNSLLISGPVGGELVGLFVHEADLTGKTDQNDMSQGMFRALSIIVQLNYAYMSSAPSCILIDDIGEGLDFERASTLIGLLIEKAKSAGVQIVMSTNDRFVMNKVPLEMWSLLRRERGGSKVYNYANSKEVFDDFRFTGLNNFDFLATDFLSADISHGA